MAFVAVLAAVSIVCAFLGAEEARRIFNSVPLTAFWIISAVLLLGSAVLSRNILFRPASLAMHLGSGVIIIGATLGSDLGHELAAKYLGIDRIPHDYVRIFEGERSDQVIDGQNNVIGQLPFSIALDRFEIDYYPLKEDGWQLIVHRRNAAGDAENGVIAWRLNQPASLPGTSNKMTVLQYLPHARAVLPEIPAKLIVQDKAEEIHELPAVAGRELELKDPPAKIKVMRFLTHMAVSEQGEVVDVPAAPDNAAIEFEIAYKDGKNVKHVVTQRPPLQSIEEAGATYAYESIHPTAQADPQSDRPAMQLEFADPMGNRSRYWLIVPRDSNFGMIGSEQFSIFLGQHQDVRQYRSKVRLYRGQQAIGSADIEVNRPLNMDGYGLFQTSYGSSAQGVYTILALRSRLGLAVVYVGFAMVTTGSFVFFWGRGVSAYLRRRRGDGD